MIYMLEDGRSDKVNLVLAHCLKVGDHLLTEQGESALIAEIRTVQRRGAYLPLTVDGDIVILGIAASSFVAHKKMETFSYEQQHHMQHAAFAAMRVMCQYNVEWC